MRVVLEIRSEPAAGKKFWLRGRQVADVGRGIQAEFPIPHDQRMSSLHFQVACDDQQCWLRDLNSRNGTFVNGQKIDRVMLKDRDTILAGATSFRVHLEGGSALHDTEPGATSPLAATTPLAAPPDGPRYQIGRWTCCVVPEGWELVPDRGIRNVTKDRFPTTLMLAEGALAEGTTLRQHVATLIDKYLEALPDCRTDGPAGVEVAGAEEALQFRLEYPQRGDVAIRQLYLCARTGTLFGMAVLTTSEAEMVEFGDLIARMLSELSWQNDSAAAE